MKSFSPKIFLFLLVAAFVPTGWSAAQQLTIPRIELMPNTPSPYLMRNWKQVARGYDSLVFNLSLTGTYLPLVSITGATTNYPAHSSFLLHTVVGTTAPTSSEAINGLPAIIGATLSGVDKANQGGNNWPLMAEEWFNRHPGQQIYKNHPTDDSGDDWWYETMPNIFFYQLNYLYPGTGDYNHQFTTVADRWLQAVRAMGGSDAPWHLPNMDHRGWLMETMTPYDNSVHEPEAAGAIAWLEYMAWVGTGNPQYRAGAEMAMEFLNGRSANPSYELQLPYGVYAAARMNAELGTPYDIPKMLNWCFDVGPLRSWGAIVGRWGNYDCSGLIGEVNGNNDYAFLMNTFEQAGALVPLVRYDTRAARAIGKWMLNAANAARLLYPTGLDAAHQDSYAWSHQYDPNGYIGHEAMRKSQNNASPFATGDAIAGGWGHTNLTLYSSSHAGIFGGIIDTTDVTMILKLDLLKTDYYHATAYPSYLLFNPYDSTKSISFDAGSGVHDLYDPSTHAFLMQGVSGPVSLPISANAAVVVVVAPANGTVSYDLDRMAIDNVVVDYHSGHVVSNYPPRIKALAAGKTGILKKDTVYFYCTASDREHDSVIYHWSASGGAILGSDSSVRWIAPDSVGSYQIQTIIEDGHSNADTASITVQVIAVLNNPPQIRKFLATPRKLDLQHTAAITCSASDPENDSLTYAWSSAAGTISGAGASIQWTAPAAAGNYFIRCSVGDTNGGVALDSIGVEVRDFSQQATGNLIAWYPFSGNANDASGNGHNGTVVGASLVRDHKGQVNAAYLFNGTTNYIQVPNSASLNVQNAISVSFWMYITGFPAREEFPISHGNWENRWKVSISNQHVRWTVKTNAGIKDLDSETPIALNTNYFVTVTYNGADMEVYLNGALDAFTHWSGTINTTTYDLTIGQILPGNQSYNFAGTLDEIRLHDYALSMNEIAGFAEVPLGIASSQTSGTPERFALMQNYPNPFNPSTQIEFNVPTVSPVTLKIFNLLGQEIVTLVDEIKQPGSYHARWDAGNIPGGIYFYRLRTAAFQETRKLLLVR